MQGKVLDTPLRTFCMVGLGVCGIFSQREAWAEGSYVGAVGSEGYECGRSIAFREDGTSFIAGVANSSTGYNSLLFSFDQNNQTLGGISFGEIKEGDQGPFIVIQGDAFFLGFNKDMDDFSTIMLVKGNVSNVSQVFWEASIEGSDHYHLLSLVPEEGGYLTGVGYEGVNQSNMLIFSMSSEGDISWDMRMGSNGTEAATCACAGLGEKTVFAGHSDQNGDFDIWIVHLNDSVVTEVKEIKTSGNDHSLTVRTTSLGEYILMGYTDFWGINQLFLTKFTMLGEELWTILIEGIGAKSCAMSLDSEDNIFLVGDADVFQIGRNDTLIAKIFSNGTEDYSMYIGNIGGGDGYSLRIWNNSHMLVTGSLATFSARGYDVLVAEIPIDGQTECGEETALNISNIAGHFSFGTLAPDLKENIGLTVKLNVTNATNTTERTLRQVGWCVPMPPFIFPNVSTTTMAPLGSSTLSAERDDSEDFFDDSVKVGLTFGSVALAIVLAMAAWGYFYGFSCRRMNCCRVPIKEGKTGVNFKQSTRGKVSFYT